ncbi:hypothetical protein SteCoe_21800 [Stentor coeruleus]|uniref:Uncharacterized protein n=1 Tax=Stentor coeruleus TaxID=5963 RepID=A0A1R2BNY6_9CILI|nr:hypothetical protein SteCoe_21800 [Stentor coeruleus]
MSNSPSDHENKSPPPEPAKTQEDLKPIINDPKPEKLSETSPTPLIVKPVHETICSVCAGKSEASGPLYIYLPDSQYGHNYPIPQFVYEGQNYDYTHHSQDSCNYPSYPYQPSFYNYNYPQYPPPSYQTYFPPVPHQNPYPHHHPHSPPPAYFNNYQPYYPHHPPSPHFNYGYGYNYYFPPPPPPSTFYPYGYNGQHIDKPRENDYYSNYHGECSECIQPEWSNDICKYCHGSEYLETGEPCRKCFKKSKTSYR